MSLYVLQFWGVARFVEVQKLKIGELVCGKDYYHLFITRLEAGSARKREVIQIYPTPTKFHKIFCPVTILSHYCKIRQELSHAGDQDFLFPKLSLSFEQGSNKSCLRVATPPESIPQLSYHRKFKIHVDSEDMKAVGVSSLDFTSDSLKLGGQHCLVNGIVCPDFSQVLNKLVPVSMEPKPSINVSRKRPHSVDDSVQLPQFGAPINRRVPVIKATGCPPPLPARGPPRVEVEGMQPPVPDAAAVGPEVQQVNEDHLAGVPDDSPNVISQPNPEETSAEPPPARHSSLGLKPEILDRINKYASISVTRAVPQVPSEPTHPPPLQGLKEMNTIVNKYSHLWLYK